MKRLPSPRSAHVPDCILQRLHTYTLAASAAGVAILALTPLGEAEIIYTPANVNIGPRGTYALDVDGDGTTDFKFVAFLTSTAGVYIGFLAVDPTIAGNAVAAKGGGKFVDAAAALADGVRIGPKTKRWGSYPGSVTMAEGHRSSSPFRSRCYGPWKDKQDHYLGLRFMIGGEIHYGWARLSNNCYGGGNEAVLTGYAYETIANQAIKAGQETGTDDGVEQPETPDTSEQAPVTLGSLARGKRL